jgi:basic membrane protein A and related proteins
VTKKRRLLWLAALCAAGALSVVAAGCGGDDDEAEPGATATAPTEEPAETISVGLVTDTGGVDDRGFNQFSIAGLEQAASELGVATRVYVSNTADDYLPNLTAAAEDGHDLVIAVGFLLAPSVIQVAPQFPETSFAGVDNFYGGDGCEDQKTCEEPNALGMVYPTEEAGYLAGIVAAMMTQSKVVASVGGIKIPPVDNWIAGFQQAVKDTDPSVKTLNQYSQDFDDQAKCKEIALDQISRNADIIFQVAGQCGLGAIDAACEQGKIAIGVDADQSGQGDCVITSALKPLQTSVFDLIQAFQQGEYEGGTNAFYGVEQLPDAELLAPYTGDVPQEVQDAVAEAKEKLASGEIDPPASIEDVK